MKKLVLSLVIASLMSLSGAQIAGAATLSEIDNQAKANYEQARQTYINEMNAYKTARQQFLAAKKKVEAFRSVENKAAYRTSVQNFLSKSVSALIKYLEALKNKALNVRGVSDAERAEIIAYIDVDINWLKEKQTILSGELTDEQLKNEAVAIQNYWPTVRTTFKKGVADNWIARVNYVISRAEELADKTDTKIDELEAQGKDTTQLKAWLEDLNKNIQLAKDKAALAKEKRVNISEVNFDAMMLSIHQFVKDANQYVRKAHSDLVKIVQDLKKQTPSTSTNQ